MSSVIIVFEPDLDTGRQTFLDISQGIFLILRVFAVTGVTTTKSTAVHKYQLESGFT